MNWLMQQVAETVVKAGVVAILAATALVLRGVYYSWRARRYYAGIGGLAAYTTARPTFTCPRCGSHCFGTSGHEDDPEGRRVFCHGNDGPGEGGCGWSGPYDDYVKAPPGAGIVQAQATVDPFTAAIIASQGPTMLNKPAQSEAELLEQERDVRWVRWTRLSNNGAEPALLDYLRDSNRRATEARSPADLARLDLECDLPKDQRPS